MEKDPRREDPTRVHIQSEIIWAHLPRCPSATTSTGDKSVRATSAKTHKTRVKRERSTPDERSKTSRQLLKQSLVFLHKSATALLNQTMRQRARSIKTPHLRGA